MCIWPNRNCPSLFDYIHTNPIIDPFHGGAMFVCAIPLMAGAVDSRKDPAIRLDGNRNPDATGHWACSTHVIPAACAEQRFFNV